MLEINRRNLPRFKFDTKVDIDFVGSDENKLQCSEDAFKAKIIDIGIQGIGVKFMNNKNDDLVTNFSTGTKKVLLNFNLDDNSDFISTFAVPTWHTNDGNTFGFKYSDITDDTFYIIKELVDRLSIINDNNVFEDLNNENALNLNILKKPDLCVKCKKNDNPAKKMRCDLIRMDQIDASEFNCSKFKLKKNKFSSLRDIKIFENLSDEEIKIVENFLVSTKVSPGDVILRERAFGTSMYIIVSGTLEIIKENSNGDLSVIATITTGHSVGEMAMVDGYVRSATVQAKTKGIILTFTREDFVTIQEAYPKIGIKIFKGITSILCSNLRNTSNKMSEYKLSAV